MKITKIKNCFKFEINEEYPNGYIAITKDNALQLQEHGWNVDFHTDYYYNEISAKFKNYIEIGFCNRENNLIPYIDDGENNIKITITNREQLDRFIELIESLMQFSKSTI